MMPIWAMPSAGCRSHHNLTQPGAMKANTMPTTQSQARSRRGFVKRIGAKCSTAGVVARLSSSAYVARLPFGVLRANGARLWRDCLKHSFRWPSAAKPDANRLVPDSKLRCPLSKRHSDAVECQSMVMAGVVGLFKAVSPSAVVGRVRAVVVAAIKCVSGRAAAHVFAERGEVVQPVFAHHNASGSVVSEMLVLRVVAPVLCRNPRAVLAGTVLPMRRAAGDQFFDSQASATTGVASAKRVRRDVCQAPAIASAFPLNRADSALAHFEGCQSPVAVA